MLQFIKSSLLQTVLRNSFVFFIVLLCIRVSSFFYLNIFENNEAVLSIQGIGNDLSFTARLFFTIGVLQWIFNLLTKKKFTFLLYILPILFIWIELALVEYLKTTTIMLDEALFNYSFSEVITISGGGASFNLFLILSAFSFPFCFLILIRKISLEKSSSKTIKIGLLFFVISAFLPAITHSNNERFNQLANNNTSYFISRIYAYYKNNSSNPTTKFEPLTAKDYDAIDHHFFGGKPKDINYPFYHEMSDSSSFASYFKSTTNGNPPNIVFIICESMSTYFVGDKADQTGHIMPFLDSLSQKSLYWPNFMSVCDRTYHVLPGSTASIPIIPGGKIFHEMENPSYYSLMNLLHQQYFSRFYCGTYLSFTQMDSYMDNNNTSYLVKDWENHLSNKIDGQMNPWGYQEKEVFLKSWLDYNKQNLANKPRLDIFLTVSTHPPYKLKEKQKYLIKTQKLIESSGKKNNIDYSNILKNHLDAYSTYTYLDDQIRNYFQQAQSHPDYENTIFIIYGDHGTGIASTDDISEYKIPLIIYSPLLKQPEKFLGVSSQLDLAPTLINYLRLNYIPKLPTTTTFIGKELSYSKKYINDRTLLLGTYLRNQDYYLNQSYFVRNGQLYKVQSNLNVSPIKDDIKLASMEKEKEIAKKIINYAIYTDKLGPKDSLLKHITNYNQKLINTLKKEHIETQKDGKNIEFIDLGEFIQIDSKTQQLVIKFSTDFLSKSPVNIDEIPKLTISIHDAQGKDIYWSQIDYFHDNPLKQNSWNTLVCNKTINLSELIQNKKTGNKLLVKYYLLNNAEFPFEMKNSKISFFNKSSK